MNVTYLLMKKEFMMIKNKGFAKKRLMFIQKEDYNFLTYNFLILLKELDCINYQKRFTDFRRICG